MFSNGKFIDRDECEHEITNYDDVIDGNIYRCYPDNDKWIAREIRWDKKKPNTNMVVTTIKSLYSAKWVGDTSIYYQNKKQISKVLKNKLIDQAEHFRSTLDLINPQNKKNWIDLGCGKSNKLNIISQYNPKSYYGVDCDNNALLKGVVKNFTKTNYTWIPADLTKDWIINNIFDYVICNFSLPHFYDGFFTKLDKITKKNSKLMVNFLKETASWKEENSWINVTDRAEYFFEWCMNEPLSEKKIIFKEFEKEANMHNWTITNVYSPNDNELGKCYTWVILEKM
jgi:ubiquinone/menaquinone biosynthesis C-methylase UbiE